jgi:hypothetical protein
MAAGECISSAAFAISSSTLHSSVVGSLSGTPSIDGLFSKFSICPISKFVGVASAPTIAPAGAPDAAGWFHGHGRAPLRATGKVARGRGQLGPGHGMDAVLPLQKARLALFVMILVFFLLISE